MYDMNRAPKLMDESNKTLLDENKRLRELCDTLLNGYVAESDAGCCVSREILCECESLGIKVSRWFVHEKEK